MKGSLYLRHERLEKGAVGCYALSSDALLEGDDISIHVLSAPGHLCCPYLLVVAHPRAALATETARAAAADRRLRHHNEWLQECLDGDSG